MDLVRAELAEHHAFFDDYRLELQILTARVDEFGKDEYASLDMKTLKTCLAGLLRDVTQLE